MQQSHLRARLERAEKRVKELEEKLAEKERRESELLESRNRLQSMIHDSPIGVAMVDAQGRLVEANPALAGMVGHSQEELLTMNFEDFTHPEDLEAEWLLINELWEDKRRHYSMEKRYRHKNAETVHVRVTCALVRGEGGESRYGYAFVEDVTESRKAREELQRSEERFRLMIENMPVLVDAMDENGDVVYWNKECERVTGYPREEVLGSSDIAEKLIPDPDYRRSMIAKMKREPDYRGWEWKTVTKDGATRILAWSNLATACPIPGWPVWGIGQDITDRRRFEDELRIFEQIVSSSSDGLSMVGSDYVYKAVNDTYLERTGLPRDEIVGRHVADIMGEETFERIIRPSFEICLAGEIVRFSDWFDFPRQGRRFVEVTYSPCYDGSGEIIGIVVNTRDSTEREEAQEHIRRSLAEKEVLLKEVHHRVKNNLQIVCSLLDLSARRVDTVEGWELAREMETKIMAMALIHSSLYERERFDAIDMDTFIRDLFGHLRRMFDGDGVRPSFCGGTLHLPLVKAIPCALFLNEALTNVFKHAAGDGGCRVTMGCSIRDGRVNILLSDDGPGFPEGFDQPGSQGLGVKLMRNLAEMQLRGEVAFEGNHGAEVRLSFPLENAGL